MKILLFGSRGQVGNALIRALPPIHDLIIADIDITDDMRLRDIINSKCPDIIINAAAYTNVDGAELEYERAFAVNGNAPRIMADAAQKIDALLIHYSTDYVFNGDGQTAWVETDRPAPLNIYGQSKLNGDEAIIASACRHLIFRTSWVYERGFKNFPTKIFELSQKCHQLKVVSDQIGAPTSASLIAAATYHGIIQRDKVGLYHLACQGETSWADFAKLILHTFDPSTDCQIVPVLSQNYASKACRPLNSRLNCQKFTQDFGLPLPHWRDELLKSFK